MSRISISRIDHARLEFDGELLAQLPSEADENGRHYVVSVFRMDRRDSLAYVPAVEYVSRVPTETSFTIAEVVEDPMDVAKFFYVFEPLEHLPGEHVNRMSVEGRQELTRKLFHLYDAAVAKLLERIQGLGIAQEAATSVGPREHDHRIAGKNS